MDDKILVSVVNPRGRVVWLPRDEAKELTSDLVPVEKRFRYIKDPKELYYPNYDLELTNVPPPAEVSGDVDEVLEIIEV